MDKLVNFIIEHQGVGTDYRIEVVGVRILPVGVKLKITFLPEPDSISLSVP